MPTAAPPPRRPLPLAAVALGLLGIGAIGAAGVLFPPSVGELLRPAAARIATTKAADADHDDGLVHHHGWACGQRGTMGFVS